MLAKEITSISIPSVSESDTVSHALELMASLKITHLPLISNAGYDGLLSEEVLLNIKCSQEQLVWHNTNLVPVSVFENQHVFEVIDVVARYNLTILPVLSIAKDYIGSITISSLVRSINLLTAAGQPGAILVLSLSPQDYSPTILSRIIEENSAKMISLYAVPDPNGRELIVTIKINSQETSSIVRSFDRYGYSVKSYFLANSQLEDFYRSRYEEFMKYMNI
jgi:acetoin utilization protein AcuB